jgi:tetratricopeptide (TPR) repeat protein
MCKNNIMLFTQSNLGKGGVILCLVAIISLSINIICAQGLNHEAAIVQAYELRMNGKSEEAKITLLDILDRDSTDAMANFEMSRLIQFTEMMNVAEALKYGMRAVEADPENSYYLFHTANLQFLRAYIAMHRGDEEQIKTFMVEASKTYEKVLLHNPDCKEAMLFLIDIYSNMNEDSIKNYEKAKQLQKSLTNIDPLSGAIGALSMSVHSVNAVDYWKAFISKNGPNNQLYEILGKAYLSNDNIKEAVVTFDKIVNSESTKNQLILHLARAHLMRVMRDEGASDLELPEVKKYILLYLETTTDKPIPVEAWCYGILSRVERFMENEEQAKLYLKKAKSLNPSFSRAFAIPTVDDPPNALQFTYFSFFKPF